MIIVRLFLIIIIGALIAYILRTVYMIVKELMDKNRKVVIIKDNVIDMEEAKEDKKEE
ncbi:MAG: hypothetical protein FWG36_00190 [Oscillospiraceae bacterium]|nr:hypothetical protein [Oscillospiraceae bacterium]